MMNIDTQRLSRAGFVVLCLAGPISGGASGAIRTWENSTGNWDTNSIKCEEEIR